jgi:thymidylate kinase
VFIAREGIDGAGKTSAAELLVDRLRAEGTPVLFARHNSSAGLEPRLAGYLDRLAALRDSSRDVPYDRLGTAHWALIRASYYALVDSCVLTPALAAGTVVVADGWYYKLVARLAAARPTPPDGYDRPARIEPFFAAVRKPDRVFLLDVPPWTAAHRKREFALGEIGPQHQGTHRPRAAFARYQGEVRDHLLAMAGERGWTVLPDPATPAAVAEQIHGALSVAV